MGWLSAVLSSVTFKLVSKVKICVPFGWRPFSISTFSSGGKPVHAVSPSTCSEFTFGVGLRGKSPLLNQGTCLREPSSMFGLIMPKLCWAQVPALVSFIFGVPRTLLMTLKSASGSWFRDACSDWPAYCSITCDWSICSVPWYCRSYKSCLLEKLRLCALNGPACTAKAMQKRQIHAWRATTLLRAGLLAILTYYLVTRAASARKRVESAPLAKQVSF